ncbi:uncharacterized protein LOC109806261 [Cajanus cajan]|uniref:uncharacterized protein LOC109806261 n=1 Tax=Cajanus cajan TaxID=3821 RepID=UPI00098DB3B3|nr:uncharacterized protein LOC109806261 [Cajanus cajan]
MANESWTDLLHSSTKLLEQAAPSAQFPPLQRNLDQLEALSKKLKSKTVRTEARWQSIAATRLLAREGINAEQLARDLKSFELKTAFEDVFPVEATSVEEYLQQVSTTKKQDKGKGKLVIPLPKKSQQPPVEKLLKDAMKSVSKDVEIIQIDSSREMSRDIPPLTGASQQSATPQLNVAEIASIVASIEILPEVEEEKVPQSEPLANVETLQESAQGEPSFELQPPLSPNTDSTESPRPFTTSPSTQGGVESSIQGLSSIPSTNLDLMSFFNEEDEDINSMFDVLDNWTSGPSRSEKEIEKIEQVSETNPSYQSVLESFRSKAYVDDLDQALLDPAFKIEVEQMVEDLLAFSDLPPTINTELQEFTQSFTLASDLRSQWSTTFQEVAQIEVESEGDRAKLEKLREDLISIRKSIEEVIHVLKKLQQEEADCTASIEALQHELNTLRSKQAALKTQSQDVVQRQKNLKEEGKVISSRLAKTLEHFCMNEPTCLLGVHHFTWMLEVTTTAQELSLGVDFTDLYKKSDLYRRNKQLIQELGQPAPGSKDLQFPTQYSQSFLVQCQACLWKQRWSYWRNPPYTAVRFFFTIIVALLFGTIFWDLGGKHSELQDLLNALGSMYISVLFLGVIHSSAVQPVISVERTVFYREIKMRDIMFLCKVNLLT